MRPWWRQISRIVPVSVSYSHGRRSMGARRDWVGTGRPRQRLRRWSQNRTLDPIPDRCSACARADTFRRARARLTRRGCVGLRHEGVTLARGGKSGAAVNLESVGRRRLCVSVSSLVAARHGAYTYTCDGFACPRSVCHRESASAF
jgi:hypothetical protein